MTPDDHIRALHRRAAADDQAVADRLARLFAPQRRPRRPQTQRTSAPAWITATPHPEAPERSIMDGLHTYRGIVATHRSMRGAGITINPAHPAPSLPPPAPMDDTHAARDVLILALAAEGRSQSQIAALVGVHRSTVGRVLRKQAA